MKTMVLLGMLISVIVTSAFAQIIQTDSLSQAKVNKLGFIIGQWEGEGWIMGRDGTKHDFHQTEDVKFKLDSTAILIEGLGKSNGRVIHNALAIMTFDRESGNYNFHSFLVSGNQGTFTAELKGEKLYWYPRENMRFIIYINENGQWSEIGEMNHNEKWVTFFSMTLDPVKP